MNMIETLSYYQNKTGYEGYKTYEFLAEMGFDLKEDHHKDHDRESETIGAINLSSKGFHD